MVNVIGSAVPVTPPERNPKSTRKSFKEKHICDNQSNGIALDRIRLRFESCGVFVKMISTVRFYLMGFFKSVENICPQVSRFGGL